MTRIDETKEFIPVRIAVLTVSDTRTREDDKSGDTLVERLTDAGHVLAARAILPLTRSQNISIRLGTRHRASLGISEETDAVTVVVSEETGAISIACRGVLHRDLSQEELANYLEKLIILEQDDSDLAETVQMLEEQAGQRGAAVTTRSGRAGGNGRVE